MPIAHALLHPGNRLLHGGTADVALFGAQPTAVTIAAPDAADSGYVTAFADRGSGGSAEHEAVAPAPIYSGASAPEAMPLGDAGAPLAALQAAAPQAAPQPSPAPAGPESGGPALSDTALSANPAPTESNAASPQPSVSNDASVAAGNPFHTPVLDGVIPAAAAEAFGLTTGIAGAALAPVLSQASAVTGTLETLAATAGDATASLTALPDVAATIDTLTASVDGLAPVQDSVAAVQDSVATTVMPLVDHLAAAGDQPLEGATDVLAGTDPAAGIATLTAMVGSADVFELADTGVPVVPDPIASTLDAVPVDAEAVSPLLGDHADASHDGGDLLHGNDTHLGIAGL